ncbi:hypothetical protein [Streptomyces hydrogenans]
MAGAPAVGLVVAVGVIGTVSVVGTVRVAGTVWVAGVRGTMPLSLVGGACAVLACRRRAVRRGAVTGHGAGTGRLRVADVREHGHAPLTRRHPVGRVVAEAIVGATGAGFGTSLASASGTGTGLASGTGPASGICASPGLGTATGSGSGSGSGLGHGTGLDFCPGSGLGHGMDFDFGTGPGHGAGFSFGTSTRISTPTGSGTGGSHRPGRRIRRGPSRSPTGRTVHTGHTRRTVRTGHTVHTRHTRHTVRISGRRGIRRTRRQVDRRRRARGRRPLLVTLHEVRVRPGRAVRQAWRPVAEGVGCQGAEARARGSEEPVHEVGHPEVTSR